jgi:LmbE family N-acetylglucosaminyl deacetylase
VATLVCFHAHPDDESIATGGVMARAAADGHRVVLVVATRGEHGEVPDGFLVPGETLAERRVAETLASAERLGVARVEFLGYVDSGMEDTPTNDAPDSFWRADLEEAAGRLAAILEQESAEVLTVYDDHGTYGHPDHVQVHRVGVRAAERAGTPEVFEATIDRDAVRELMLEARARGLDVGAVEGEEPDTADLGVPTDQITTRVDVTDHLGAKRASMRAHASQISEQSFFLAMPDEVFHRAFGTEWFIHRGVPAPVAEPETTLLP